MLDCLFIPQMRALGIAGYRERRPGVASRQPIRGGLYGLALDLLGGEPTSDSG